MPTDHGLSRPRHAQNRHYTTPVTGPYCLDEARKPLVASGGSGTPLNCPWLSPGWSWRQVYQALATTQHRGNRAGSGTHRAPIT